MTFYFSFGLSSAKYFEALFLHFVIPSTFTVSCRHESTFMKKNEVFVFLQIKSFKILSHILQECFSIIKSTLSIYVHLVHYRVIRQRSVSYDQIDLIYFWKYHFKPTIDWIFFHL